MKPLLKLLGLMLLYGSGVTAGASEAILDYRSVIAVQADGAVIVTETLRVRAEGQRIKRGIYRDFPTGYQDSLGRREQVSFEVLDVLRDGRPEPWHEQRGRKAVRVYIGRADKRLPAGEYTYTLRYRSGPQVRFFEDHDELYWNVTGNEWAFPIARVSASVALPAGVPVAAIHAEAYTGPRGAKGQDYRAEVDDDGISHFQTTRPLKLHEGLTLVVTWPKGHVHEPSAAERRARFLAANTDLIAALAGLSLLLTYYLLAWHRVGRDPEAGVVIARYLPPKGFSPASMRFIRRMGYDNKAFTAALINLAVKGYVTITEAPFRFNPAGQDTPQSEAVFRLAAKGYAVLGGPKKVYVIEKQSNDDGEALAAGEAVLLKKLFRGSDRLSLDQRYRKRIQGALKSHKTALERDYEKVYFKHNRGWFLPGLLLTVLTLIVSLMLVPEGTDKGAAIFLSIWLSFWSLGVGALLLMVYSAWREIEGIGSLLKALFVTAFAAPFLAGEGFGMHQLAQLTSWGLVMSLIAAVLLNLVFYQLLKAPTLAGRRLLDRIEGFRLYLDVAEKDDLKLRHPDQDTPELYQRYLPYALALDVEQHWSERFAEVLARAQRGEGGYAPAWYHGAPYSSIDAARLGTALGGALTAAIASSSGSSGSGGGGSSGGGGGGGGGGGW